MLNFIPYRLNRDNGRRIFRDTLGVYGHMVTMFLKQTFIFLEPLTQRELQDIVDNLDLDNSDIDQFSDDSSEDNELLFDRHDEVEVQEEGNSSSDDEPLVKYVPNHWSSTRVFTPIEFNFNSEEELI